MKNYGIKIKNIQSIAWLKNRILYDVLVLWMEKKLLFFLIGH